MRPRCLNSGPYFIQKPKGRQNEFPNMVNDSGGTSHARSPLPAASTIAKHLLNDRETLGIVVHSAVVPCIHGYMRIRRMDAMSSSRRMWVTDKRVTIVIPKGTWIPAHLMLLIYNAVNERKMPRGNWAQGR